MTRSALICFAPCLAFGCEGPLPPENPKTQVDQRADVMPITEQPAQPTASAEPAPAPPPAVVYENVGLETPESVLYDADSDLYIVANIAGRPDGKDGNGFVSQLSPDGSVKALKWIASGQNGVVLNAPKGLALFGGKLWVSDIDHVRRFDVATGEMEKAIAIPGATFLNDVAIGKDGTVYVSDTGVKVGKEGFEPTETDAIYEIVKDKAQVVVKSTDLARPNGLVIGENSLFMVNFGGNLLREIDLAGKDLRSTEIPTGGLDGLVRLGDDDFLVSSWQGRAVYRGGFGTPFSAALSDETSPADIGFDSKRNRILIPVFQGNAVRAVDLPEGATTQPAASATAASQTQ